MPLSGSESDDTVCEKVTWTFLTSDKLQRTRKSRSLKVVNHAPLATPNIQTVSELPGSILSRKLFQITLQTMHSEYIFCDILRHSAFKLHAKIGLLYPSVSHICVPLYPALFESEGICSALPPLTMVAPPMYPNYIERRVYCILRKLQ